jgi:hypothetical protein
MTEVLDEFYRMVPEDNVQFYKDMAQTAIHLGYKPKRDKTKHLALSFSSSKYKVTILRFVCEKNQPSFRLKFFATKNYSAVFDESIKHTLEEYNFKYVGCYGCEKCPDVLEGYDVVYEDGRKYFRCGFELIEVSKIDNEIEKEVEEMLETQTKYYEIKIMKEKGSK